MSEKSKRRLPAAYAMQTTTSPNETQYRGFRHSPNSSFISQLLASGRIHRVHALLGTLVFAEFELGTLRLQTSLRVPEDELADFLLECERQGALEGLMVRPGTISNSIPQASVIRRLLFGTQKPAASRGPGHDA